MDDENKYKDLNHFDCMALIAARGALINEHPAMHPQQLYELATDLVELAKHHGVNFHIWQRERVQEQLSYARQQRAFERQRDEEDPTDKVTH
jgi:hypothetical protein